MQRFDGPNYGFIWLYSAPGNGGSNAFGAGNYEFAGFSATNVLFIISLFTYICMAAPADRLKFEAVLKNPARGGRVICLFTSFIRCI